MRDCEGSEPDSPQMFSWEENGQHILEHFNNGFNSGDPSVNVNLYGQKERFYVAGFDFKGWEPCFAL